MNRTVSSVLKGAAAGAVVGTAAYMAMGTSKSKASKIRVTPFISPSSRSQEILFPALA